MFPKILFTLYNACFFLFRVTSILCLAGFVYGVFTFASNNFVFPNPYFLAQHMFAGYVGMFMWVNARILSRRMVWLV